MAIEVPDFDARLTLLTSTLGMVVQRIGALVADPSRRIAMVGDGTGTKLEIVEGPDGTTTDRLLHVAWRVGDVDAKFAELVRAGCTPVTEPKRLEPARSRTATVADTTGAQIQLVAYDADSPDL